MNMSIHKPYVMFQTPDYRLVHFSPQKIIFEGKTKDSLGVSMWEEIANENMLVKNPEFTKLLILMGKEMVETHKLNEELQDDAEERRQYALKKRFK